MIDSSHPLEQASDELSGAFARLEQAVAAVASKQKEEGPGLAEMEDSFRNQMTALQDENVQLREENATLYAQLQQLREAYDDVQERNEQIAFKIDRHVQQLEMMA